MRPFYPISSKESKKELKEIQEHLVRLIGYDSNVHDSTIERPGLFDTTEAQINASGLAMLNKRLYSTADAPLYSQIYRSNLAYNIVRKSNG